MYVCTDTALVLPQPYGCEIAPDGKFALVADSSNNRIRRIDLATNRVTTVAGSTSGFKDDTGTKALFKYPTSLTISGDGKVAYISDNNNLKIRKLDLATTAVSTIAGTGSSGNIDGIGEVAKFNYANGLCFVNSSAGDGPFLLVAGSGNQ